MTILFVAFLFFKNLYPDLLWFESLGYENIWWFQLKYQYLTFAVAFLLSAFWLTMNGVIANKVSKKISADSSFEFNTPLPFLNKLLEQFRQNSAQSKGNNLTGKVLNSVLVVVILGLSFLFALAAKSWWLDVFYYLYQVPYGMQDPLFDKDISFYLLSLPFFNNIYSWTFSLLFVSILFVGWIYLSKNILLVIFSKDKKYGAIKTHIITLLSLLFLLLSYGSWIDILELVYSTRGAVIGAAFTDITIILPIKKWLVGLYVLQAITILMLINKVSSKVPYVVFGIIVLTNIVGLKMVPNVIQNYVVSPNELAKEENYIKHNIKLTREAYQLDSIFESEFPANNSLTKDDLKNNNITVENIRLWNQEPLKLTFRQLQEIRPYYEFLNVDVDRYMINGELQQVMLSPREFDTAQLTQQAQTWLNQHLVYTHGYGLCMTPVSKITEDGLPHLYVKDIPPTSTIDLTINRPEIYFGEKVNEFVVVNTNEEEFDYPKGDENEYTSYQGSGGIKLDSLLKRLVFSVKFNDFKLFVSSLITNKSKLLFDHSIDTISQKLTPFIIYDEDPYLVVTNEGRLVWMRDGYTISTQFPYAENINKSAINYIRNAVKITIDAYDGTTQLYIADQSDPIVKTLDKIYPNVFKPLSEMPSDLRAHIRYPKGMFTIQAIQYATYHMTNPKVFYNREDLWEIPKETYDSITQDIKPYYLVTKLPGEEKESFVLMMPFSPTNKDNMIGWMAVKCDPDQYGEFVVYKLPKDKTIYGPMQIESRIDQDTEISESLTLWGQVGSRVIRGNLMIIPIEDSLVYVEPIYLQAEQSQLPELKRVVLAYDDTVTMSQNLNKAIDDVFGVSFESVKEESSLTIQPTAEKSILTQLFETYDRLKLSLKNLDFKSFGLQFDHVDNLMNELKSNNETVKD